MADSYTKFVEGTLSRIYSNSMDTGKLKRFATEARSILMKGVKHRLQSLGFDLKTGQAVEMPVQVEGGAVFMKGS